jgi:hypothetical protein
MEPNWRDELILREMETVGPEPKRKEPPFTATGQWTPAALDRLLADVCGTQNAALIIDQWMSAQFGRVKADQLLTPEEPSSSEIDRYLLAWMSEKHEADQLVIHRLKAQIGGLRADLTMAERTVAVLRAQMARMSRPWWRRVREWAAEFVAGPLGPI